MEKHSVSDSGYKSSTEQALPGLTPDALFFNRYFRPSYPMKKREKSLLKIQNIVASGSVAEGVDLEFIGDTMQDCTFSKKKFPGAVFHIHDPKSAALIFASGRVVLTGNHRTEDIPLALRYLVQSLRKAGIACKDNPQFKVTNIVCTYDLGLPLNLVRITIALMDTERIEYEPEAFPGLVLRISDPRMVFLLFSSGKIVITGGTNLDDITSGLDILLAKLSVLGVIDPVNDGRVSKALVFAGVS
jgi:transcription initiation factor TFIID TATA-box-binding protein